MKYKNREVIDLCVAVECDDVHTVRHALQEDKILVYSLEKVEGGLVLINPAKFGIKAVNSLFSAISPLFEVTEIHILYDDFDENGFNLETAKEPLDEALMS